MPFNDNSALLGMDLGTTYSAVAKWDGREPVLVQSREGDETTPSAFLYRPRTGETVVGKTAKSLGAREPEGLVLFVKRLMDNGDQPINLGSKTFTPIEISAKILEKLYADEAHRYPGNKFHCRGTVVTVPYYFMAHQIANTRRAAESAGINVIGIIQEPIAASLAYAWHLAMTNPGSESKEKILVFDLGGGTFDLTLFDLRISGRNLHFEVLATGGDDRLGGIDFDKEILNIALAHANKSLSDLPPSRAKTLESQLMMKAETVKSELSFSVESFFSASDILPDWDLNVDITRGEFEEKLALYIERIDDIVQGLWIKANSGPAQVDRVIRVGGSCKIPVIEAYLNAKFPGKVFGDVKPSLVVAEGAALYAAIKDDPDAFGCNVEITTRTCHALGIEISGGRFEVMIPANQKAPFGFRKKFRTNQDSLSSLTIPVYQGSAAVVSGNSHVGDLHIPLPPDNRKGTQVEIEFLVRADQRLSVSAKVGDSMRSINIDLQ